MKFLPELRDFLLEHGVIYTVRGYDMKPAWVDVVGIGCCRRTPLGGIHSRIHLVPYVGLSGFSDVEGWWSKIGKFVVPGQGMWLYKVEVKR